MARVLAVFDDLLLGSNVIGLLRAAGHEAQMSATASDGWDVLVVDVAAIDPSTVPGGVPRLGIYSHVNSEQREAAEAAGFDLVVPRSRFMREGPALIDRLTA